MPEEQPTDSQRFSLSSPPTQQEVDRKLKRKENLPHESWELSSDNTLHSSRLPCYTRGLLSQLRSVCSSPNPWHHISSLELAGGSVYTLEMDEHYHSEHLPRNPTVKRLPAHRWSQENSVMVTKITRTGPGTGGSLNLMTSRFSYCPETGDDAAAYETTSLRYTTMMPRQTTAQRVWTHSPAAAVEKVGRYLWDLLKVPTAMESWC